MNNFVKRTLSGTVFVLLLVGSIIWSQYSFGVLFAIIAAFSVYEFHKLTNQQEGISVNPILAVIGGIILFKNSFLYASDIFSEKIFLIYGIFLILVFIAELYRQKAQPIHNWAYFLLGQIFVALPFALLNFIPFTLSGQYQPLILLAVFVVIWVNDTGAYLTGITFGKRRLFERISPKKSWEGFFGGAIFALLPAYIFSLFISELSLLEWIIFAQIIVVFGTFGDLIESLLKRTLNVKDSGNIIPGHGGLLDRFDSMLLAVPAIFMYLQLLKIY